MAEEAPADLLTPLVGLYYVPDPQSFAVLDDGDREFLLRTYSPDEILSICDALTWAVAHPDYPFLDQFGDFVPGMRCDNQTIIDYFEELIEGMRPLVDKLRLPP